MQNYIQEYDLSFNENEYIVAEAKQNDNNCRVIKFHLNDDTNEFHFDSKENLYILLYEEFSNGTSRAPSFIDISCLNDNVLSLTLMQDMLSVAGLAKCEIVFCQTETKPTLDEDGNFVDANVDVLSTQTFYIDIKPNHSLMSKLRAAEAKITDSLADLYVKVKEALELNNKLTKEFNENEDVRKSNENTRINTENKRIENENTRIANEEYRQLKEDERQSQEFSRVEAENVRVKSEQLRFENEAYRQDKESERITNENIRISREDGRLQDDKERQEHEAQRIDNENKRLAEEQARIESENVRVKAEMLRFENEAYRQDKEAERINAENDRVEAEKARVVEFNAKTKEAEKQAKFAKEYGTMAKEMVEGANFKGATAEKDGQNGLVIPPKKGDEDKVLVGGAEWVNPDDLKLSMEQIDSLEYDKQNNTLIPSNFYPQENYKPKLSEVLKSFSDGFRAIGMKFTNFVVNNLVTTAEGYALDARQGKVLDEKITNLSKSVATKVPFNLYIKDGKYGYLNDKNVFTPFKSQDDIDSAVSSAKVGTATTDDVLRGKTFTTPQGSGLVGAMPNLSVETQYQHDSGNATPHIFGDKAFFSNVYDKTNKKNVGNRIGIRTGANNNGKIDTNTLISLPSTDFGDASTANVISGKTFTSSSGLKVSGTMVNNGSWKSTINPKGSVKIPQGYHDGTGVVTANANQNDGTYAFPANDTGGEKDLGVNNTIRKVSAVNVYNKGKSDGDSAGYSRGKTDGINATKKGNATVGQVLSGQTFTSASAGVEQKGTMANRCNTIQNATTATNNTSNSCYRIRDNRFVDVIPAIGYWGTWDWNKERITVDAFDIYKNGYNNGIDKGYPNGWKWRTAEKWGANKSSHTFSVTNGKMYAFSIVVPFYLANNEYGSSDFTETFNVTNVSSPNGGQGKMLTGGAFIIDNDNIDAHMRSNKETVILMSYFGVFLATANTVTISLKKGHICANGNVYSELLEIHCGNGKYS